jgi:hypothetical protein
MVCDGKPKGFLYLDHWMVDGNCNIITDVHITLGNIQDSIPYLDRIDRQKSRFNESNGVTGCCRSKYEKDSTHGS